MREVMIVSAVRTPIGSFMGGLSIVPAIDLAAIAIKEGLKRAGLQPEDVDEVILGNVLQAGQGQNPARQAAVKAGIPIEVPAITVNMLCGSGQKAISLANQAILSGDADIVVAGGTENMSQAPFLYDKGRTGQKMGHVELVDSMIKDGLWCAFTNAHMGITAENLAERYRITREEQDEFAFLSQQKAKDAVLQGRFRAEIVPVPVKKAKGEEQLFAQDEHPRFDTTIEKLAQLKPAFKKDGTVTAGNSSGINDAAAVVVLMSREKAGQMGIKPIARIRGYSSVGVAPEIMGIGPVYATRKALAKAGLKIDDLDLIEVNEAFAAQALTVIKELSLNLAKVNVNGGAIALGHPIGASGARILVTLLHEMKRSGNSLGLATLCIGGGQGIAMIIEMEG